MKKDLMRALVLGLTVIMLGACAKEEQAEKEMPEMDAESALKELREEFNAGKDTEQAEKVRISEDTVLNPNLAKMTNFSVILAKFGLRTVSSEIRTFSACSVSFSAFNSSLNSFNALSASISGVSFSACSSFAHAPSIITASPKTRALIKSFLTKPPLLQIEKVHREMENPDALPIISEAT